ncbi:MAG: FumA C-terminus/TtdB family hydratase beta subunit [Candidatus Omnitrophica bacterium]|nr:FumA C-terminus/TtdB family hydratase beta subunit [Candidatus Omnitrophota bacterium]
MMKRSNSILREEFLTLRVSQKILFSGIIYTARDQAHKRLVETIKKGGKLPIDLKDKIVYYCGPTKTPKGKAIGACGPTTSSRMDEFAPCLLEKGVLGMIGKGARSAEVKKAIKKYKGIYFLTYAGCGALLSKFVCKMRVAAYKDLGPEAIHELEVKDFPLIVGIDSLGRSIYG